MKNKINVTKVLLFLVILSLENFCCLVPSTQYLIPNLIKYSDIGIVISIMFFAWVIFFVKFKEKTEKARYPYKWLVLSFVLLVLSSSIMAKHFFNQPVLWGIRSQRQIITVFLLYFPISKALQTGAITKNDLIKDIMIIATIEMILYTIQYFLVDKIVFLNFIHSDTVEMRLGMRRLRYPIELPLLAAYFSLNSLLNSKRPKLKDIMYILWFSTILIIMVQKRTQIISFIASVVLIFFMWKKNIGIKLLVTTIIFTFLIGFILNSSIIQSTIYSVVNRGTKDDTLTIREAGIEYYKERVKDSLIFGYGFPNENSLEAKVASGQNQYYYLADDGIYGFYYVFGLSGIIWITFFWSKNLLLSYKMYNNKKIYIFILYFIYESVDLYIGMKWYYYWPLAMGLVICLLSNDYMGLKKGKGGTLRE